MKLDLVEINPFLDDESLIRVLNDRIDEINDWARDAETEGLNVWMGPNGISTKARVTVVTGAITLDNTHEYVSVSSGTFTITLPASPVAGQRYWIKNRGAGTVTVDGNGNNIFTTSSVTSTILSTGDGPMFWWDGSFWNSN